MTGTRDSLSAMIGQMVGKGAIRRRILQTLFPLLLTLPQRANFKQMARWSRRNEGTLHRWFEQDLELPDFQRSLIDSYGSGDYCVLFDPSYLPKSGRRTPGLGRFWSGQAGAVKRGLEVGVFAVGDVGHHTAFHLSAHLTPACEDLRQQGRTLMDHYVSLVRKQQATIQHFGGVVVADGYFGVSTFVQPLMDMGLEVVSCLKANAALHYLPPTALEKRRKGRPRVKGPKIKWDDLDENALPVVWEDSGKRVRSASVWVKCLKRVVRLVSVEYLKGDGSRQSHKLYFSTNAERTYEWILQRYALRFQIEFLFRDAKQFTGLTHCQSTNPVKLENHLNLALGAVSVAKAAHWIALDPAERAAFSLAQLKEYYHNLALFEQFSIALNLNPTETKNNPKIKELLFSNTYARWAA